MLKKYTIYGERCSGTNYLENIMDINFDAEIQPHKYGWKHFFGFQNDALKNSDETLFICIVRNLSDWINSFYREKHHLPLKYKTNLTEKEMIDEFLNKEIWSIHHDENGNGLLEQEILADRNIYTGERYKNIFELRHTKIKWMIEDLPNKVKNSIFIKYEDLINDLENTLLKIKNKGLLVKEDINFPLNISTTVIKSTGEVLTKKRRKNARARSIIIPTEFILSNPNLIPLYEKKIYKIFNKSAF